MDIITLLKSRINDCKLAQKLSNMFQFVISFSGSISHIISHTINPLEVNFFMVIFNCFITKLVCNFIIVEFYKICKKEVYFRSCIMIWMWNYSLLCLKLVRFEICWMKHLLECLFDTEWHIGFIQWIQKHVVSLLHLMHFFAMLLFLLLFIPTTTGNFPIAWLILFPSLQFLKWMQFFVFLPHPSS